MVVADLEGQRKEYVVRPSRVVSKHDADTHFIPAPALMRLHRVNPRECIVIEPGEEWPRGYDRDWLKTLTWLTPDFHGNYAELLQEPS